MILITDTNKARRDTIAEMFYYMGILSRAVRPEEVEGEIGDEYSALLFTSVDFPDAARLAASVRSLGMATVVAITDVPNDVFELCFAPGTYSATIVTAVSAHRRKRGLSPLGRYERMGFDASADSASVSYFGEPIPLTRTEAMILRYLIKSYPRAVSPKEVLKYAFRGSRMPELSSVRTHISIMNKKLRQAVGKTLTEPCGRGGYVLSLNKVAATV